MKNNLLVLLLLAVILLLLIPLTSGWFNTEKAFTPDNFITVHTVSISDHIAGSA